MSGQCRSPSRHPCSSTARKSTLRGGDDNHGTSLLRAALGQALHSAAASRDSGDSALKSEQRRRTAAQQCGRAIEGPAIETRRLAHATARLRGRVDPLLRRSTPAPPPASAASSATATAAHGAQGLTAGNARHARAASAVAARPVHGAQALPAPTRRRPMACAQRQCILGYAQWRDVGCSSAAAAPPSGDGSGVLFPHWNRTGETKREPYLFASFALRCQHLQELAKQAKSVVQANTCRVSFSFWDFANWSC